MKFSRLALAALAAVLVGLILIATQPVSGQVEVRPVVTPPPPAGSVEPVTTYVPAVSYRSAGQPQHWFYGPGYPSSTAPDPELGKLLAEEGRIEQETAGLIAEFSRTEDESQRGKTKAKLAATLEKQFDLQQKRRDLEVARIEAQLKKLRDIMRKRGESRQTIIDKRLDQLLREADGLGWTPQHGAPLPQNALFAPAQSVPGKR
jgi:hypothetical protein